MLIFSKLVSNYASSSQILFFFLSWEYTIGDRCRELDWLGVAAGVSAAGPGHRVRWSIREFATPVSSVTGSLTPSIPPLSPPPPGPGPTLLHRKPLQAAHRKCTFIIPGYLPAAHPSLYRFGIFKELLRIKESNISFSIFPTIHSDLSWVV